MFFFALHHQLIKTHSDHTLDAVVNFQSIHMLIKYIRQQLWQLVHAIRVGRNVHVDGGVKTQTLTFIVRAPSGESIITACGVNNQRYYTNAAQIANMEIPNCTRPQSIACCTIRTVAAEKEDSID